MSDKAYEEVGANYRFFLGWRHASFAGNLVVLYGVVSLTATVFEKHPGQAWLVPLVACPVGLLLWIIDVRTRDLYHAAIRAGKHLESDAGGFYTELSSVIVPKGGPTYSRWTQSTALNVFFLGSSLAEAIAAILLYGAT